MLFVFFVQVDICIDGANVMVGKSAGASAWNKAVELTVLAFHHHTLTVKPNASLI